MESEYIWGIKGNGDGVPSILPASHEVNKHGETVAATMFAPPPDPRGVLPPFPGQPFSMPMGPGAPPNAPFPPMQQPGMPPWKPDPMMPPVMQPAPEMMKQPAPNKVLVLPPPPLRTASYNVPLPNDCDGLVFALEGKFKVGDEIISDAAAAILLVLTDKLDKVSAAHIEGWGKPKLKAQILKSLENSWITSNLLGDKLVSVSHRLKDKIESIITTEGERVVEDALKEASGQDMGEPVLPPTTVGSLRFGVTPESLATLESEEFKVEALVTVVECLEKWVGIRHALGVLEKQKPKAKRETLREREAQPRPIITFNPNPEPRGVGRPRARRIPTIGEFVDSLEGASQIPLPRPPPRNDVVGSIALSLPPLIDLWQSTVLCVETELKACSTESHVSTESSASADTAQSLEAGSKVLLNTFGESTFFADGSRSLMSTPTEAGKDRPSVFADSELSHIFLESVKEVEFLQWKEQRRQSHPDITNESDRGDNSGLRNGGMDDSSTIAEPVQQAPKAPLEALLHGEPQERSKQLARIERDIAWSLHHDIGLRFPFLVSMNRLMIAILKIVSYIGPIGYTDLIHDVIDSTKAAWQRLKAIDTKGTRNIPQVFTQLGTAYMEAVLHFAWEQGIIASRPAESPGFFSMAFHLSIFTIKSFAKFVTVSLFPSVATRTAKTLQYACDDMTQQGEQTVPVDLPLARAAILVILVGLDEISSIPKLKELTGMEPNAFVMALLWCTFSASVVYGRIKGYISDADAVYLTERREESVSDSLTMRTLIGNLPAHMQEKVTSLIKRKRPLLELSSGQDNNAFNTSELGVSRRSSVDASGFPIAPGSYTNPLSQTPPERDLIDSTKERSTAYGAEMYGPIFEDIIYTCSATLASVARDPEPRAILKKANTILEEIAVLSRSSQIANLCRCIAKDEPFSSLSTDDDESTSQMDDDEELFGPPR
eukprot:Blabericola_migrator_1__5079@NODE_262_length_10689_cov_220_487008_g219_i0_p1_GENE_NODE_262_length_10689_cov_220_487008_g219_i0NODE_262_length_10689_cov_220_487008_g219_i0_p1_ORF_typecomplete_len944_score140_52EcsB/PF05975_12/0_14_NODE_262_length_10689_cov_220_487008_g219_i027745605